VKIAAGLVLATFALCSYASALYEFDCNASGYQKCDWPDLKITLLVDPLPGERLPGKRTRA
jgi:hypothetical protein